MENKRNNYTGQKLSGMTCIGSQMSLYHQLFFKGVSNLLFVNWFFVFVNCSLPK